MKYYRVLGFDKDKQIGFECSVRNNDPWNEESMILGFPLEKSYEEPIKYYALNNKKLIDKDMPWSDKQFIISDNLASIFMKLNNNYQIYKSEIYKKDGSLLSDKYYSFIFTNAYPVINWEESDCENDDGLAGIIHKLVLSSEKLSKVDKNDKIFRMYESRSYLIASQEAKDTIENAGIDTLHFHEIEVI